MKSIKLIHKVSFIALLLSFITTGCSDFLDEQDPSNLTAESYYTRPEHAEAAVNAIYHNLRFMTNGTGIFAHNFQMLEAVTGTAGTETGQNQDLNNLLGLAYNGENLFIRQWWNSLYSGIANANLAIQKIPGITMDEELKMRYMAEAQFLRALHYFWLVRLWGDVPLLTEPVDASSPELYPERSPQENVYELIVNDLTTAEMADLQWMDQSGRVSLGAVKTLLAKVYLTMAGHPLNLGSEYYQLSADKAKEVIDNGSFSLFDNYDDLHSRDTKNMGEHIFMVQFAAGVVDNPIQEELLPNFKEISALDTEVGSTVPTEEFYNSYAPGDRRIQEQEFFYTQYYHGGSGELKDLEAPYIFKHFDRIANGYEGVEGTRQAGLNWPLFRYAEVLLVYAEAQNEVAGPSVDVYDAVNGIRERANLLPLLALTQDQLREAIWKERWHELCYENKTWFDMVRLRKVFNSATFQFDDFAGHTFTTGPALQEKHLLFPLPTAEMQNNPNLTPQNPGY